MRKRLSSYDTLFYQVLMPAGWFGMLGLLSYVSLRDALQKDADALPAALGLTAFTLAVGGGWCWGTLRLKKVVLLDDSLRISGWLRSDTVPLANVAAIRRGWLLRYLQAPTATIKLHGPCWFGDAITFVLTGGKYGADRTRHALELAVARAVRESKRRQRLELEPDPVRDFDDQGDELDEDEDEDFDDDAYDDDEGEPTIACPYCGAEIHEDAPRCPSCGEYISTEDAPVQRKPWWIVIGVAICLLLVYLWTVG